MSFSAAKETLTNYLVDCTLLQGYLLDSLAASSSALKVEVKSSSSIPISNYIPRTPSELQLSENEALAEYKDNLFFTRVVNGIKQQQLYQNNVRLRRQSEKCLANIISTRNDCDNLQQDWKERNETFQHQKETLFIGLSIRNSTCEDDHGSWFIGPSGITADSLFDNDQQEEAIFNLEL